MTMTQQDPSTARDLDDSGLRTYFTKRLGALDQQLLIEHLTEVGDRKCAVAPFGRRRHRGHRQQAA